MFSLCPFDISVSVGAFIIGLGQISSFLSLVSSSCHNILEIITIHFIHTFYHYKMNFISHNIVSDVITVLLSYINVMICIIHYV